MECFTNLFVGHLRMWIARKPGVPSISLGGKTRHTSAWEVCLPRIITFTDTVSIAIIY
jgi:hypothetical protein